VLRSGVVLSILIRILQGVNTLLRQFQQIREEQQAQTVLLQQIIAAINQPPPGVGVALKLTLGSPEPQ
jgi:hypothetical protein